MVCNGSESDGKTILLKISHTEVPEQGGLKLVLTHLEVLPLLDSFRYAGRCRALS